MITLVEAPIAGNAIRLFVSPPTGAQYWRVLRRTDDAFAGATDPNAVVVVDQYTEPAVLDTSDLVNGTEYFYRDYAWNGTAWIDPGKSVVGTPASTYTSDSPDPQTIVRDRLELGLAYEVASGNLHPQSGKIQVLLAPFSSPSAVSFPCVSVHVDDTAPSVRGIGEEAIGDFETVDGQHWEMPEAWLAQTSLAVVGVSLNADERRDLRMALRRVIQANLPIFDSFGMVRIDLSQRDEEQFSENNAPLYVTRGTFTCLSPAYVRGQRGVITDITVDGDAFFTDDVIARDAAGDANLYEGVT